MKLRDREQVFAAVEQAAEREAASVVIGAIARAESELRRIKDAVGRKYSVLGASPELAHIRAIGDAIIDSAFCRDALESLSIDYSDCVSAADIHEELLGDDELVVADVRKSIISVLTNLAGTE